MTDKTRLLESVETALKGVEAALADPSERPASINGRVSVAELEKHGASLRKMSEIVARAQRGTSFRPSLSDPVIDHWSYDEQLGIDLIGVDRAFEAWKNDG